MVARVRNKIHAAHAKPKPLSLFWSGVGAYTLPSEVIKRRIYSTLDSWITAILMVYRNGRRILEELVSQEVLCLGCQRVSVRLHLVRAGKIEYSVLVIIPRFILWNENIKNWLVKIQ